MLTRQPENSYGKNKDLGIFQEALQQPKAIPIRELLNNSTSNKYGLPDIFRESMESALENN